MSPAVAVFVSYALLFLSDRITVKNRGKGLLSPLLFILGVLSLIAAFSSMLFSGVIDGILRLSVFSVLLFLIFLGLLLYTIFPGLTHGGNTEDAQEGKQPLVSVGVYALCRHPGVLWMMGCCGMLFSICPTRDMAILAFWTSLLDLIYVWWQDVYIFPYTISHYERYKMTTPFLIPTPGSILKCLNYLFKR